MAKEKRSFFERLTGAVRVDDDAEFPVEDDRMNERRHLTVGRSGGMEIPKDKNDWPEDVPEDGQLTVDVYQTPNDIVIKTIVAGVKPEDLDISISRDMVVIKGKREETREVSEEDYFHKELYWGGFSRTIILPEEIDVDSAEAIERHGLLTLKLPKVDKRRQTKLRVKVGS